MQRSLVVLALCTASFGCAADRGTTSGIALEELVIPDGLRVALAGATVAECPLASCTVDVAAYRYASADAPALEPVADAVAARFDLDDAYGFGLADKMNETVGCMVSAEELDVVRSAVGT